MKKNRSTEISAAKNEPMDKKFVSLMRVLWDRGYSATEISDKMRLEHGIHVASHTVYNYVLNRSK
jgi:hypothetical protein